MISDCCFKVATVLKKGSENVKVDLSAEDEDIEKLEAFFGGRTRSQSKLMTKRLDRWITASIYIQNKEETWI